VEIKMIRAKFVCNSAVEDGLDNEVVRMSAVTADTEENKTWCKYTPAGSFEIYINNPDAKGKFVEGKEYFIDIHPAEKE